MQLPPLARSRHGRARLEREREREGVGTRGPRAQHEAVDGQRGGGGGARGGERADEGVVAEGGRVGDLVEQGAGVGGRRRCWGCGRRGAGGEELGEREGGGEAREAEASEVRVRAAEREEAPASAEQRDDVGLEGLARERGGFLGFQQAHACRQHQTDQGNERTNESPLGLRQVRKHMMPPSRAAEPGSRPNPARILVADSVVCALLLLPHFLPTTGFPLLPYREPNSSPPRMHSTCAPLTRLPVRSTRPAGAPEVGDACRCGSNAASHSSGRRSFLKVFSSVRQLCAPAV